MASYDHIIIGSGPAGCLIANHLVTQKNRRVLLLEAGPVDKGLLFRIPAGFLKYYIQNKHYWDYRAVNEPQLGNRCPRMQNAKVLGGGSSVNAMVHIRGQKEDYDDWATITGISDLNSETFWQIFHDLEANNTFGGKGHGVSGPLHVSNPVALDTLSHAFVAAAQGAGMPYNPDFNSGQQNGVGFYQTNTTKARRWSAVDAFIKPLRQDKRLTIIQDAFVERILFEDKKAVGVSYQHQGSSHTVMTNNSGNNSVILSAGAIASPKVLMLSGIGDSKALENHGIDVLHHNPAVGANLIDHCEVPISAYTHGKLGYYKKDRGLQSWIAGLQYLAFKSGPAASNGVEAGGFFSTKASSDQPNIPNIQIFSVPGIYLDKDATDIPESYGITLNACLLKPKSRGYVRLASSDPQDLPTIKTNFLNDPEDMRTMLAALKKLRGVLDEEPLKALVKAEALPGVDFLTDEQWISHIRKFVKTVYHPMGTCRIGRADDPMAVVDEEFSVKGVEGLKVIDASVFPSSISGNTCAAVYATAQYACKFL